MSHKDFVFKLKYKTSVLYCQICTHNTYRVKWINIFVTPLRASRKFVHYDASCRYTGGMFMSKKCLN